MSSLVYPVGTALLILLCLPAAWLDLRYRRIPNWLCAVTALLGLLAGYWAGGLPVLGSSALHMAVALAGGMVLFAVGAVGGGDAKFYAGVAAWFSLAQAVLLLVWVTLSGLVLLIGWFSYRRLAGYPFRSTGTGAFDSLPYGLAIGAGAIAVRLL